MEHHELEYSPDHNYEHHELNKIYNVEIRHFVRMFEGYPDVSKRLTERFLELNHKYDEVKRLDDQIRILDDVNAINRQKLKQLKLLSDEQDVEVGDLEKRFAREIEKSKHFSITKISKDAIEIIDNFDRSLENIRKFYSQHAGFDELYNQIHEIRKHLEKEFEKNEIRRMDTKVGDKFDPNFHHAITFLPIPHMENDQILDITQVGYMIGERVLRHVKVVVVKNQ